MGSGCSAGQLAWKAAEEWRWGSGALRVQNLGRGPNWWPSLMEPPSDR